MWLYPEIRVLGDLSAYYARTAPDQLVFSFAGHEINWRQFEESANQFAHKLAAEGLKPRERLGFLGVNSYDYFIAMFAAAKAGMAFLPLNWRLTATELGDVVAESSPALVIVERSYVDLLNETFAKNGKSIPY